jgi:hypothetical protein
MKDESLNDLIQLLGVTKLGSWNVKCSWDHWAIGRRCF